MNGVSHSSPTESIAERSISLHLSQPQTWLHEAETQAFGEKQELLLDFDLSKLSQINGPSPGIATFEWYDLLARDAISRIHRQTGNAGPPSNEGSASTRQDQLPESPIQCTNSEPWATSSSIELTESEAILLQHYIEYIAPVLDLFDPLRHFTSIVPRLALRNVGLMKSIFAAAARHFGLMSSQDKVDNAIETLTNSRDSLTYGALHRTDMNQVSAQYYYETLHYLSQALSHASYTRSHEILASAIMISTYEMLDSNSSSDRDNWHRHLRGTFWIQRNQDNDGESEDAFRQAVWWVWLRQDIWAAFRQGRRTFTIWRPKKPLSELSPDQLATRVVYIAAKCVEFAAADDTVDIIVRLDQSKTLLKALDDWKAVLPSCFEPIANAASPSSWARSNQHNSSSPSDMPAPVWIHPSNFAAAMQMYHFARIVVLIHQPSIGGLTAYRDKERALRDSVDKICAISLAWNTQNAPSAFVSLQTLSAGISPRDLNPPVCC